MPMHAFMLEQGDRFTHVSAGGGGFGDPFERDPAAVLEDVLDGKVYGRGRARALRRRRRRRRASTSTRPASCGRPR